MGLWDWTKKAAGNIADGVSSAASSVAEAAGSAKDFADGVVSKTFDLGWEEEATVDAAGDAIKSAATATGEAISTAADWTMENVAPVVEETGKYIGSYALAVPGVIAEAVTGEENGITSRLRSTRDALGTAAVETGKFAKWACWDDPGRAWSLAAQGVTDAVVGTVVMVGDAGRSIVNLTKNSVYNIGADVEVYTTGPNGEKVAVPEGDDLTLTATIGEGAEAQQIELHLIDEQLYLIDAEGNKTNVWSEDGKFYTVDPMSYEHIELDIKNGSFSTTTADGTVINDITIDADSQKQNLLGENGFFYWSTVSHDATQFVDPIEPEYLDVMLKTTDASGNDVAIDESGELTITGEKPDGLLVTLTLEDNELKFTDENGEEHDVKIGDGGLYYYDGENNRVDLGISSSNLSVTDSSGKTTSNVTLDSEMKANDKATYERIMLYGSQAVLEIPVAALTIAGSGGTAAGAWAAKWGGTGLRTVNTIRRADMVMDAMRYTSKLERFVKPLEEASTALRTARRASRELDNVASILGRNADNAVSLAGKNADDIMRITGKNADEILELTGKHVDEIADMARKADDLPRLTDEVAQASTNLQNATKAQKAAGKADEVAQGTRRSGTLGDAAAERIPGLRSFSNGVEKLTQNDLMEYLAKSADDFRDATKKLAELQESGANASAIARAERTVARTSAKLDDEIRQVNMLTRNAENGLTRITREVAETATKTTEDLSGFANTGARMRRGFELGTYKSWRFADPMRSPLVEATAAAGGMGLGVYMDYKNGQSIMASSQSLVEQSLGTLGTDQDDFDSLMDQYEQELDSTGNAPSSLQNEFPGGNNTVPNENGGNTSNTFNNRSNGTVSPLNQPVFTIEVPEDVANTIENSSIKNQ